MNDRNISKAIMLIIPVSLQAPKVWRYSVIPTK